MSVNANNSVSDCVNRPVGRNFPAYGLVNDNASIGDRNTRPVKVIVLGIVRVKISASVGTNIRDSDNASISDNISVCISNTLCVGHSTNNSVQY